MLLPTFSAIQLLAVLVLQPPAAEPDRETRVKAQIIVTFTKYVEWPSGAFENDEAPWVLGVIGDDPIATALERFTKGKTLQGRRLVIRRLPIGEGDALPDRETLATCHIVFLPSRVERLRDPLLSRLHGAPVMCVSDARDFAINGGLAELVIVRGAVKFKVNRAAERRAKLEVSARALQLATEVVEETRAPQPERDPRTPAEPGGVGR